MLADAALDNLIIFVIIFRVMAVVSEPRGEQLLKGEILRKTTVLGSTPSGSDWALKALHPSDPLTEVRGIPDRNGLPTVLMNYQAVLTIAPTAGAQTPWSFEASLLPHPINFLVCDVYDSIVPAGTYFNCPNGQLTGVTHSDRYHEFRQLFQRWRLAYMSVTCYQDGPDLANQGTICVSQPPVMPLVMHATSYPPGGTAWTICQPATHCYTVEDKPSYTTSQSMPSAYLGRSREGAYVPLKLSETCQEWRSEADACYISILSDAGSASSEVFSMPTTNPGQVWPHVDLVPRYTNVGGGQVFMGQLTSAMLSGNFAHISGRNLSNQTSFTFYVRCGIEGQVSPNSVLAPQLKLPPPYDPVALDAYFSVARELKDAYPSNYNDLGKLWDEISSIAKTILPYIPTAGPVSQLLKLGTQSAVVGGDAIRAKRKAKKARAKLRKQATGGAVKTNGNGKGKK